MSQLDYKDLAKFGQVLLKSTVLEEGLPLISRYSKGYIGADRCSIFVYDRKRDKLWTTIADGMNKITISPNKGIVGRVIHTGESIIENDVSRNPYFLGDIDKQNKFKTINIVAVPILNVEQEVIGVLELLNKDGGFTNEDEKFMKFFTNFVSTFIALAPLYEEL